MRYRWVGYRYAEVVRDAGSQTLGDPWGGRLSITLARPHWRPPADLYEVPEGLIVKVEVAGLSDEDFDLTLYDDALVIEGVRAWSLSTDAGRFHAVEVRYGPFRLELPLLIQVDRERVRARYDLGFLTVTLPKMEARIS